jgi:hypothetical protein
MLLGRLPWQVRAALGVALLGWVGYRLAVHQTGAGVVILGIAGVLMLVLAAAGPRRGARR